MNMMKNSAFVGNTGHFDNEIDMADPEGWEGMKVDNIKPQVDPFVFPVGVNLFKGEHHGYRLVRFSRERALMSYGRNYRY